MIYLILLIAGLLSYLYVLYVIEDHIRTHYKDSVNDFKTKEKKDVEK